MFKNYLLVAWRNLVRNKVFSIINITGVAIGLSVCFLIYQYVQFEKSYDLFHQNAERIYRIPIEYPRPDNRTGGSATNHPAVGPALKADFPEVEAFTRLAPTTLFNSSWVLSYEGKANDEISFNEDKLYLADDSFLKVFSFPLLTGDVSTALKDPLSIVLTEKVARKYFGDEPALGKEMSLNREVKVKVTGVLRDIPQNSHLQFDVLVSFATLGDKWGHDNWGWPEFYNYILLSPEADPRSLEAKLPSFVDRYLSESMRKNNFKARFLLQPLTSIHLTSHMALEQDINGNERSVYFLTLLAVFVLVIAWINYVNLSTAKSLERSKEVGLRKVVGAQKRQLIVQFFFDAFLVNLFALLAAAVIIPLSMPFFEDLAGKDIGTFMYTSGLWRSTYFWILVPLGFIIAIGLVGLYPSMVLSSFNPAVVLKGKFYKSPSGVWIRKGMVSFQYILSIFLIAGTVTIYRQLIYMEKTDAGYAKDQMLVVRAPAIGDSTLSNRMEYFKNTLKQYPSVSQVSASTNIPGNVITDRNFMRKANQKPGEGTGTYIQGIDRDFIETFDMTLLAGRSFHENEEMVLRFSEDDEPEGTISIMINEEATKLLGYEKPEDALHEKILFSFVTGEHTAEVVGIVKNYHQRSLREKFLPILYYYHGEANNMKYIAVQVKSDDLAQTIATVEKTYRNSFGNNPFEYFFLDDHFNKQYSADRQFGAIFSAFTLLAIVVACLGLLGLSVFATTQRIKEIGIRKVLGAPFSAILLLFTKDSIRILILSYLISVPVIYMVARDWLNNFAFHTGLGWEIFVIPFVSLLIISFGTICTVCLKAALMNPSLSLRQE
jgi:putative ABC transport system permease protein